ncbi:hypothetical protein [Micromonospora sp. IBSANI012]|uniref:hypothetical protein n=1 Tax=Micromonospora sp. IBSANI012 TaxID=3457761 RepID=UPI00405807AB
MAGAELVVAHDLELDMWYGQFVIRGGSPADPPDDALFRRAQQGAGIAGDGQSVLVLSPHQANVAMPIRVEVTAAAPADDLVDWEEAFEAGLAVDADGLLLFDSPTAARLHCPVPPGRYRIQVAGRGFVSRGWPGSTRPGDRWRVRLWPAAGPVEPRRLKAWPEPIE